MNKTPKNKKKIQQRSRPTLIEDILSDTLTEFRSTSEELRDTLDAIRQEMAELSRIQKKNDGATKWGHCLSERRF